MSQADLQEWLDQKVDQYNRPSFIEHDPISIPHRFSHRQDIEIMGFWAAVLAWGQRPVILKKAAELVSLMDGTPYDFVKNHQDSDLKRFLAFKHRTFNATDTLYFLHFFREYYQQHDSLEWAFIPSPSPTDFSTTQQHLEVFHDRFCASPYFSERTRKHVATPARHSACKRLNMFLRWMVRRDTAGVDFGLWANISPAQLVIPIDVHVGRVAHHLSLLDGRSATQPTWKTAVQLTRTLQQFDPNDPVKYDFALFGLGVDKVL